MLPALLEAAWDAGLHTTTVWLFSTHNWRRSATEVNALMAIIEELTLEMQRRCQRRGVRIRHLGRRDRTPCSLASALAQAEVGTTDLRSHVLNLGVDYGGQDEILRVFRRLAESGITPESIDDDAFLRHSDLADQPYPFPDLILRTSGDRRLSGFMPWHGSHSELCFIPELFPDLTWARVAEAVLDFSTRRRSFGA